MQVIELHVGNSSDQQIFVSDNESGMLPDQAKTHCWYCSRPLYTRRTFCSTECREALYEDNDHAKKRRMILGCQC